MEAYQMKPSGVEWLGDVPEHWKVNRLKYFVFFKGGQGFPHKYQGNPSGSAMTPFMKVSDINSGAEYTNTAVNYVSDSDVNENSWNIVPEYSVLLAKVGEALRKNHRTINTVNCLIDNNMLAIIPKVNMDITYLQFFLKNLDMDFFLKPGAVPSIGMKWLRNYKISSPPLPEQQAIADYLDQACNTIDQTIEVKKKQLEKLAAYRKSVIHEAVTKGLDQDVPMKYSGEPVVGSIPHTWQIKRLKTLSSIRYGLGQPPALKDDGLPLIRATNVKRGKISTTGLIYIDPDDLPSGRDPYLKFEEIIVVRSGAYTADSAIIPKEWEGSIAGYDMVVTAHFSEARFLAYALLSKYVLTDQLLLMTLRAAQPHLNVNELGSVFIANPYSRKEQQTIANYLDQACNTIDQSKQVIEKQVAKLTKYRKSLIHECVTGKKRIYQGEV